MSKETNEGVEAEQAKADLEGGLESAQKLVTQTKTLLQVSGPPEPA